MKIKINSKLLPIKGHFLLFNAGTAPLVPYLSTYARQLGFTSATVGLIYTILPIFGLIAKPLFGMIADRFKSQKLIFILFQLVTIISFSSIYLIPGENNATIELDCGNGATVLKSCYNSIEEVDTCTVSLLGQQNGTATCDMNCDMTSPKMWQTVCEHWHIPHYCFSDINEIQYKSHINKVTINDQCAYIHSNNVTLDEYYFSPKCHTTGGYVDIDLPCNLNCTNTILTNVIGQDQPHMTCVEDHLSYRFCVNDTTRLNNIEMGTQHFDCDAKCDLNKQSPWKLMEICESWDADVATSCQPRTAAGQKFPTNLSFTGVVLLSSTIAEHSCVYMQLKHVQMPDGSTHYPNCISRAQYQMEAELFHSSCSINCDNTMANEIFQGAADSKDTRQYTRQFWLFFMLMIISWIGQAVVVTFADAICFNILGAKISHYGKQRLWGSVGWGIFSLSTGVLIDLLSDGAYKDYTIAFILMFVFMSGDVIVSCFIKVESTRMSMNILQDVGTLLSSLPTVIFVLWTIGVGLCTGLLWNFLFWYLEDISAVSCDGSDYTKTLQGLVSAIQTFGGEIPFLFISGRILKKVGHENMMSLVLFAFGVRFVLYSFITNAWWVLPVEMLQGITFGMFYPTMTSYATVLSPPGTETTVQGLVGAVFEGVGTSFGSFIGGRLYNEFGGKNTFRWFGCGSLILCTLHIIAQYLLKDRRENIAIEQDYTSIIRYDPHNDTVFILDDANNE